MKRIFLVFVFALFLISFASAEFQTFGNREQGKDLNFIMTCGDCTFNNITYLTLPNSKLVKLNKQMGKDGTFYNYTIKGGNLTIKGEYLASGVGDLGGTNTIWNVNFFINRPGEDLTTPKAILYIFLSVFVMLLFCLSLFFTIITPYSNKVNETGEVIKISKLKYVKLGLIMLDYILLVWVLNTLIGISDSFLSLTIFFGFVSFLFNTLNNIALPFGIFIIVLSFFEIIKDANIQKQITRLGSFRSTDK